ncbi:MAG: hypothetical protein JKX79_04730 [Labilibaculum sp.]|nr:hypothetical protein [Labilibaculum sp.]
MIQSDGSKELSLFLHHKLYSLAQILNERKFQFMKISEIGDFVSILVYGLLNIQLSSNTYKKFIYSYVDDKGEISLI